MKLPGCFSRLIRNGLRFAAGLMLAGAVGLHASDDEVLAEMKRKMASIQQAMVGEADPAKQADYQAKLRAIMEETVPRLSPQTRPLFEVSLKVVQPFQDLAAAYMQHVGTYAASPKANLTTITSPEDIDARIVLLDELLAHNEQVLARINSFEADCEKQLAASNVPSEAQRGFMAGLASGFGRQLGPMRAIRGLDTQAYHQLQQMLRFLKANWGHWQATNGTITWENLDREREFVTLATELDAITERQTTAQQVLVDRMQGRK